MARGWESKAVEAQQADAGTRTRTGARRDPADAARDAERATLALARARALSDLQMACAPAHRAMLEAALADLDARLAALAPRAEAVPTSSS